MSFPALTVSIKSQNLGDKGHFDQMANVADLCVVSVFFNMNKIVIEKFAEKVVKLRLGRNQFDSGHSK